MKVSDDHVSLEAMNPRRTIEAEREVQARIKPKRRTLVIISALTTGWLPWGKKVARELPLCGSQYVMCCGHSMRIKEAQQFVDAGLLSCDIEEAGFKRPCLIVTPAGRVWLQGNWK